MGIGPVIDDDEWDIDFTSWDEWAGVCGHDQCENPIDFDNCASLFIGADGAGHPIILLVCSTCAYQHRLELELE